MGHYILEYMVEGCTVIDVCVVVQDVSTALSTYPCHDLLQVDISKSMIQYVNTSGTYPQRKTLCLQEVLAWLRLRGCHHRECQGLQRRYRYG